MFRFTLYIVEVVFTLLIVSNYIIMYGEHVVGELFNISFLLLKRLYKHSHMGYILWKEKSPFDVIIIQLA